MNVISNAQESSPAVPPGVRYARVAGHFLGGVLIALGLATLFQSGLSGFNGFRAVFFVIYGILLNMPFAGLSSPVWKISFASLVLFSVAFVFIMIAKVMFDYMAAAEQGERLGVPGFEGTLIFLALMQVPAVLFYRNPDLLD